jgi:hypothetical protein
LPRDSRTIERIYESVKSQSNWANAGPNPTVQLVGYEWEIILALLAQELGVQSLKDCGLREVAH